MDFFFRRSSSRWSVINFLSSLCRQSGFWGQNSTSSAFRFLSLGKAFLKILKQSFQCNKWKIFQPCLDILLIENYFTEAKLGFLTWFRIDKYAFLKCKKVQIFLEIRNTRNSRFCKFAIQLFCITSRNLPCLFRDLEDFFSNKLR